MDNDPLAGVNTDDLEKKDGKWQFRENGRTDAKDEIGPTEEELAEFWAENNSEEFFDLDDAKEWLPPGYRWVRG